MEEEKKHTTSAFRMPCFSNPPTELQKKTVDFIRAFEARRDSRSAHIERLKSGGLRITIDRLMLYQTSGGDRTSYLRDSDDSFDEKIQSVTLSQALNPDKKREDEIEVKIKRRYKKLPVPYFDIPLPVTRAGTMVRDFTNLAVQPVKVQLTFTEDLLKKLGSEGVVRKIITAATLSPDGLPSVSQRTSHNPIKWLTGAPLKSWGADLAELELNTPYSNSGLIATAFNWIIGIGLCILGCAGSVLGMGGRSNRSSGEDNSTGCDAICGGCFLFAKEPPRTWISPGSSQQEVALSSYKSRFSIWAATTVKIAPVKTETVSSIEDELRATAEQSSQDNLLGMTVQSS